MTFASLVEPLLQSQDLNSEQAERLMSHLMSGEATEAQIGSALTALRVKGCTGLELASFARVLRAKALSLDHKFEDLVDTCGTGGGCPSFNLSTAAAIVASAAGARVAKHGNRAITSPCGSADVLEALGVKIVLESNRLVDMLQEIGIAFMFAPAHHAAMKHVGPARKDLGFRTVFNQLGPLANPAGATRQLIGVFDEGILQPMAEALSQLGAKRALIVRGSDGLDEISPSCTTYIVKVWHGSVEAAEIKPATFGLEATAASAYAPGSTTEENAGILLEAISMPDSPRCRAVLPSAAATLYLAGIAEDLPQGAEIALGAVRTGKARAKLNQLVEASNS